MIYQSLPEDRRYIECGGQQMGVVQKEYPTASNLGKSRRQGWDVAVVRPDQKDAHYDHMDLWAVVECGMNEAVDHLTDDIDRLCHAHP
jgi:hypothetical protein